MRLFSLLGSDGGTDPFIRFINNIKTPLNALMIGMLAIMAAAAIVFAIWVGFRLAKAEDEGKRKEAKQQLLWSIIAVVATVALFMIIQFALKGDLYQTPKIGTGDTPVGQAAEKVVVAVSAAINALLTLATVAAMCFAIYVGVRLAMAQDEGKRKEAKQQMLWTIIAIVAAIALTMIIGGIMQILVTEMNKG